MAVTRSASSAANSGDALTDNSAVSLGTSLLERAAMLRMRAVVSTIFSIPVAALSMLPSLQFAGWQWLVAVLATPVLTWGAWPLYRRATIAARHGSTTMDTLVSLGVIVSAVWSYTALLFGSAGHIGIHMHTELIPVAISSGDHIYFEGATVIVTFVLIGRYLEARSRYRAGDAVRALLDMQARTVTVLRGAVPKEISVEDVNKGDIVLVAAGDRVPVDGVVISGISEVDTSALTGEPVLHTVQAGSTVFAGYVNGSGSLQVKVEGAAAQTRLARIADLVSRVQASKPPIQQLVDRIAAVFVPFILAIALATLIIWLMIGAGVTVALTAATAVLVVACPCALGLATPTALLVGTGRAAELGIIVRDARVLEQSVNVDTVIFDKTGTLTVGKPTLVEQIWDENSVAQLFCYAPDKSELLSLVADLESQSRHPLAAAFTGISAVTQGRQFTDVCELSGRGLSGTIDDMRICVGSRAWMQELGVCDLELETKIRQPEQTLIYVAAQPVQNILAINNPSSGLKLGALKQSGLKPQGSPSSTCSTYSSYCARHVITLEITGMSCASCVRRVEQKLANTHGVEVVVNLALEIATVTASEPIDPQTLVDSVEQVGYHATIRSVKTEVQTEASPEANAELRTQILVEVSTQTENESIAKNSPLTTFAASAPAVLIGVLALADQMRPESADALSTLRAMGVSPLLLTGDRAATANNLASALGFSDDTVFAQISPEGKQIVVERLQQHGHTVAMVGDGINDAAALAQAGTRGLGIAMGEGADVAIQAADIVISRSDPRAVAVALRLARRTMATIKTNLAWAFAYNVVALPLAACGLISPIIATAAMAISSILVVGNSLRLRRIS